MYPATAVPSSRPMMKSAGKTARMRGVFFENTFPSCPLVRGAFAGAAGDGDSGRMTGASGAADWSTGGSEGGVSSTEKYPVRSVS